MAIEVQSSRARIFTLGHAHGIDATPDQVRTYLERNEFFWLDVAQPEGSVNPALLDLLGLPPDTHEFLLQFPRRASILRTEQNAWIVLNAAIGVDAFVEIHAATSTNFLVTTRQHDCPPLDRLLDTWISDTLPRHRPASMVAQAVYRLVDTVVTSYTTVLDQVDEAIDDLEAEIIRNPSNDHLQKIFGLQRSVVEMRRVVVPQRDMFGRVAAEIIRLPHEDESSSLLFRVAYDQLVRLTDLLDNYRDLLSGALDMHLSTVSNRLGQVTTQLTIIATIFLPLSFITGFFGQNFDFLIGHIKGPWLFLGLGIGTEVVAIAALYWLFRRRGWIGPKSQGTASSP